MLLKKSFTVRHRVPPFSRQYDICIRMHYAHLHRTDLRVHLLFLSLRPSKRIFTILLINVKLKPDDSFWPSHRQAIIEKKIRNRNAESIRHGNCILKCKCRCNVNVPCKTFERVSALRKTNLYSYNTSSLIYEKNEKEEKKGNITKLSPLDGEQNTIFFQQFKAVGSV